MKAHKQLVIFFGPPGSGKGSLSHLCVQGLGWKQLSTGYLCRKHINEQTEIGKQIDFSIKTGKLITDKIIIDMVEQWLSGISVQEPSIILDGFPRNLAQAEALHDFIIQGQDSFEIKIFKFFVSDTIVLQRLLGRYICANKDCEVVYSMNDKSLRPKIEGACDYCSTKLVRRSDDEDETIRNRLKTYRVHENDLINFYSKKGVEINQLDGEKPLDMVFSNFKQLVTGSNV